MNFLIVNNDIIQKEEASLTHLFWNKPFVISQKIWFGFGGIPLFNENIDSLIQQLKVLNVAIPNFMKNKRELFRISKRMLNKNRFYKSGILDVQIYILDSGVNYTITSQAYESAEFPFSKNGLLVEISGIRKDSTNPLNQYTFYNSSNWKVLEAHLRNSNVQNSIILNEKENTCEGISSNIFMVKDKVLVTPSMESGCFEDTLRNAILEVASQLKIKVLELANIKKEYLLEMNELFFASEQAGIEWILGIENKRFVHYYSDIILRKLNEYLKEKVN